MSVEVKDFISFESLMRLRLYLELQQWVNLDVRVAAVALTRISYR